MTQSIKLTSDQLGLLSAFQRITHITAYDCIDDTERDRIIFVVNNKDLGLAIGKGGVTIKKLIHSIKRNVELVEYNKSPEIFIKNILGSKYVHKVVVNERLDGSMQAIATVDAQNKGLVVGMEGRHIKKARLMAARHFGINHIAIDTSLDIMEDEE
ncbi:MAG: NusA-like transcription termination signal-binding factor [Candidatus Nitrosoabyssus spongiisocia]|nr:MAG: NusA-like transcription termination signal-binding factor [Nitrosopumilaceae archaeon AB1(1)]